MAIDTLLARLQGVRSRGPQRWIARCPAHKDRSPSLSIREEPDGRILLHDFAGCSVDAILDALNLECSDLFPERLANDLPRVRTAGAHAHAAVDAWRVLRYEVVVVQLVAADIAAGMDISPEMRERMLRASSRIDVAASWVLPS